MYISSNNSELNYKDKILLTFLYIIRGGFRCFYNILNHLSTVV